MGGFLARGFFSPPPERLQSKRGAGGGGGGGDPHPRPLPAGGRGARCLRGTYIFPHPRVAASRFP
jgi:hypothetical protein